MSAAGTTIMEFTRNLSRITQPCVLVEAMVVSEMNDRLSPKKEPPTTMATMKREIYAGSLCQAGSDRSKGYDRSYTGSDREGDEAGSYKDASQ